MPAINKIHPVKHSAENMYELVSDIEKYPQFVPLCTHLNIRSRQEKKGRELILADMGAGYKAIQESFTCNVILHPEALNINVSYIDGPFKHLNNVWKFKPIDDRNCNVYFDLDYEFKSKMLGMLMGSMFDTAFKKFTTAFEERANELYGVDANS